MLNNSYAQYAEKRDCPSNYLDYEDEFTEPEKIANIKKGCIICNSDIKGNENLGYYCEECNLMFSESNVLNAEKKD